MSVKFYELSDGQVITIGNKRFRDSFLVGLLYILGEQETFLCFSSILDLESLMPSPAQSYGIWGKEGEARAEVRGKRICLSSQHFIYVYYIIIFKF